MWCLLALMLLLAIPAVTEGADAHVRNEVVYFYIFPFYNNF